VAGAYDMSYVESVSRAIGSFYRNMELSKEIIIVEKSTVPILTHRMIKDIISANQQVASNK
jgi:UDP-glucose 6-dehydrogenase